MFLRNLASKKINLSKRGRSFATFKKAVDSYIDLSPEFGNIKEDSRESGESEQAERERSQGEEKHIDEALVVKIVHITYFKTTYLLAKKFNLRHPKNVLRDVDRTYAWVLKNWKLYLKPKAREEFKALYPLETEHGRNLLYRKLVQLRCYDTFSYFFCWAEPQAVLDAYGIATVAGTVIRCKTALILNERIFESIRNFSEIDLPRSYQQGEMDRERFLSHNLRVLLLDFLYRSNNTLITDVPQDCAKAAISLFRHKSISWVIEKIKALTGILEDEKEHVRRLENGKAKLEEQPAKILSLGEGNFQFSNRYTYFKDPFKNRARGFEKGMNLRDFFLLMDRESKHISLVRKRVEILVLDDPRRGPIPWVSCSEDDRYALVKGDLYLDSKYLHYLRFGYVGEKRNRSGKVESKEIEDKTTLAVKFLNLSDGFQVSNKEFQDKLNAFPKINQEELEFLAYFIRRHFRTHAPLSSLRNISVRYFMFGFFLSSINGIIFYNLNLCLEVLTLLFPYIDFTSSTFARAMQALFTGVQIPPAPIIVISCFLLGKVYIAAMPVILIAVMMKIQRDGANNEFLRAEINLKKLAVINDLKMPKIVDINETQVGKLSRLYVLNSLSINVKYSLKNPLSYIYQNDFNPVKARDGTYLKDFFFGYFLGRKLKQDDGFKEEEVEFILKESMTPGLPKDKDLKRYMSLDRKRIKEHRENVSGSFVLGRDKGYNVAIGFLILLPFYLYGNSHFMCDPSDLVNLTGLQQLFLSFPKWVSLTSGFFSGFFLFLKNSQGGDPMSHLKGLDDLNVYLDREIQSKKNYVVKVLDEETGLSSNIKFSMEGLKTYLQLQETPKELIKEYLEGSLEMASLKNTLYFAEDETRSNNVFDRVKSLSGFEAPKTFKEPKKILRKLRNYKEIDKENTNAVMTNKGGRYKSFKTSKLVAKVLMKKVKNMVDQKVDDYLASDEENKNQRQEKAEKDQGELRNVTMVFGLGFSLIVVYNLLKDKSNQNEILILFCMIFALVFLFLAR